MSADHLEIEDKYDVAEGLDLPSLVDLPGVTSITGPHDHELEATSFDTAELSLTAAGITVRRRTGGEDAGWHLKLPTKKGRFEMHQPLNRSTKTVPKALRRVAQCHQRRGPGTHRHGSDATIRAPPHRRARQDPGRRR